MRSMLIMGVFVLILLVLPPLPAGAPNILTVCGSCPAGFAQVGVTHSLDCPSGIGIGHNNASICQRLTVNRSITVCGPCPFGFATIGVTNRIDCPGGIGIGQNNASICRQAR